MTDFITKMLYDEGHFDAVEHDEPLFSKPIWKTLVHETRTVDDRTRILSSKSFNPATNPNIIPGIYTRPCTWVDDLPESNRLIHFVTRQTRFAHSGAHRPIDALRGIASVWWNNIYCKALNEIGVPIQPSPRADDWKWYETNKKDIERTLKMDRQALVNSLTKSARAYNIDVLGQGGEFIVLNQDVIDWDRTREASGFQSAHRRRYSAIKGMVESIFEEVRDLIMDLRSKGDGVAYTQIKPIATSKVIVLHNIMLANETREEFFARVTEIAHKHGFKVATTHDPFESGQETPAKYGFTNLRGKYLFR